MAINNKVIWTEGMFLRPQHFQQQERHLLHWMESRCTGLIPHSWGLTNLSIDQEMLALGKIAISNAKGIFPDGTPFNIPHDHISPSPLEVPQETKKNEILFISLPLHRKEGREVASEQNNDALSRYQMTESDVKDMQTNIADTNAKIETGELLTRIKSGNQDMGAFTTIPIAMIMEIKHDGQVILDDQFIPTCLNCIASTVLVGYIQEIQGLLLHQSKELSQRLGLPSARGTADIVDFLYLQIVNRNVPLFNNFSDLQFIHPIELYQALIQIAGELATITRVDRLPEEFPPYIHTDLTSTFDPVIKAVRESLNWVPDHLAVAIPLKTHPSGVRTGTIHDRALIKSAIFVLAVNADVPIDKLRSRFPRQITVAPAEKLQDLVLTHTPGIQIRSLAVAPRQIPFNSGFSYFELDQHSKLWQELEQTGTIALHFSGDYPDLQLELWAIKGQ
jgi:type VI secretion system protein ImpJ